MTFTILNRKKQYQGHAFDVSQLQIRLPDNRERYYDLVEHNDSITILPVDEKGQIHFVTQYRIGAKGPLLELPAGVLETGEAPLDGAHREVREEIGLAAKAMQTLGGFYLAAGYTTEFMTAFLATGLYAAPLTPDADEFINVSTLTITETYALVRNGGIQDSKTLAALLLAQPFLQNR